MIIEIDELNFGRYSAAQLAAVRPDLEKLAGITRRNLHLLDTILGEGAEQLDMAREYNLLCVEVCETQARIEALEHDLATARALIGHLEAKLAAIEDTDEEDSLYATVGLVATAHEVVVSAARRALLGHLHPDRAPDSNKAAATVNFQRVNAAFDRIARLRG